MEEDLPYPVFFECDSLSEEQKKKIKNYFQIQRRSGGGECGAVTHVSDKVYRIDFKDRHAQRRVLQKSEHSLEFAGGPVVTVCDSLTSRARSMSPAPNFSLSQQQGATSTPSFQTTTVEDYELQLDPYLLRYLDECPEANKKFETQLTSISCSAKLYPEDGKVSVRNVAQPGALDDFTKWKADVDKVFDGYTYSYVVEPHKVKALFQSCSSSQTTNEVQVYKEGVIAVIVGECSQVSARLKDLDDSHNKRASLSSKKQTITRRLGKAKVRLLWKDIEHNLKRDFPQVKVTKNDLGQIVLEGSVEEIFKAGELISEEEKFVLERTVPGVSPHLLAYLRKAYGEPGVLGDYLGVRDKVEIELSDTELSILTLSADKLDDTEKKLGIKFKEDKIDVPNCTVVPIELREKLKCKENEINQGHCKAQLVFGSGSKVCLLGQTEEVEDLSELVKQFILDHSSIEGKLILPFPELVQQLPELLRLHKFDCSGVTFHPLTSSSGSTVVLEGPAAKMTEVRNRLGPFLDSLSLEKVTIDMPGAGRYFTSPSGRANISSVAQSQKCLVQLEEQCFPSRQTWSTGGRTVATYTFKGGLQVLVCQGDITQQSADALVNAANEKLEHHGGVAAALSKAGGPAVQKESSQLVKQTGKLSVGEVVVTTGGNLKCKKLLHAVGPIGGKSGGKERQLLEKAAQSTLNLAELMEFQSLAMPCISSGVFGVPVTVCSEAIVTAVRNFCSVEDRSLKRIILIDNREEVVRAMQVACDNLLQGVSEKNSATDQGIQLGSSSQAAARGLTTGVPRDGVHVEIIRGDLKDQQVDCLVCPMSGHDPVSIRVGKELSNIAGPQLAAKFYQGAGGATIPGDTVLVEGLSALPSNRVVFLNLIPWDNDKKGNAVQVLRQGIKKILACCRIRAFGSVALPVLGTGAILRFPHSLAARVLLEEVQEFEKNQASGTSFLVRIVIHNSDKESSQAFQTAQEDLHLRGFTNDANPDKASFYRHVSLTTDEVTAMLGGVQLQMVHGNIIHETTDVIVNTTDFSSNQSGVSKAILAAAGPTVQAELARVGMPADRYCITGAGLLGCVEIIHASFFSQAQTIQNKCKKILKHCETKGYSSAAFPAINTGAAGMVSSLACKAMLDGMTSAITDLKPTSLSLIRIVILEQPVFQAFRTELENRFGQTASRHLNRADKIKQKLKKFYKRNSRTATISPAQGQTISFHPPPAVFSVIGCGGPNTIRSIKRDLEGFLQKQLLERVEDVHDFFRLEPMELEAVQVKIRKLEISLDHRRLEGSGGLDENRAGDGARAEAQDRVGSGKDVCVLRGLKEDVLSVTELLHKAVQKALREDLQEEKELKLALQIQWSLKESNGSWTELDLHQNYLLEEAHSNQQVSVEIKSQDGRMLTVNLRAREATDWLTGFTYKVKRTETEAALELPSHWEPMEGETFQKFELQTDSEEYKTVAQGFLRTAKFNICKIERVQNVYLWHAYTISRQRITAKNGPAEVGEKSLYHGTSAGACECIEKDKFDRGFAGQHAAAYGRGVYFAVNADYSAGLYAPPDAQGLKRVYVARVLTGRYTLGNSTMKAAPPRGSDRTDCFDSVVNNMQQPIMFVIFHDDQAYPEYLITFKS